MDTDYKTRVEAGMAWLDDNAPGWERKIDFATLDLSDGCDCVLGQTLRELAYRRYANGYDYARCTYPDLSVYQLGFSLNLCVDGCWEALEAEWRTAIKARFDRGVLSDDVAGVRPA